MLCTAPINIDSTTTDNCLLKCLYFFNYGASSVRIDNETTSLSVSYDGTSDVVFNNVKYTANTMEIYTPSLHTYDGASAAGEILIMHTSDSGLPLIVSVPLVSGSNNNGSNASTILSDIINNAPASNSDGTTSYNATDFNLNYIVPKASYYSYQGTAPYNCTDNLQMNYIVFALRDGPLYISADTLTTLQSLISPPNVRIYRRGIAYYNDTGTIKNGFDGDGQIYIDCQPTGEDGEILYSSDADGDELPLGGASEYAEEATTWFVNSIYFVIGVLLMLLMVYLVNKWVFKQGNNINLDTLGSTKKGNGG